MPGYATPVGVIAIVPVASSRTETLPEVPRTSPVASSSWQAATTALRWSASSTAGYATAHANHRLGRRRGAHHRPDPAAGRAGDPRGSRGGRAGDPHPVAGGARRPGAGRGRRAGHGTGRHPFGGERHRSGRRPGGGRGQAQRSAPDGGEPVLGGGAAAVRSGRRG